MSLHEPRKNTGYVGIPANVGHPSSEMPAAEEIADALFAAITHMRP
jgi:hypothetical protein